MNKKDRPLSPHLQIYKPQLTSVLSITHRATGIVLTTASIALFVWLYALVWGEQTFYEDFIQLGSTWIGQIVFFGVLFSFYFHLGNGIRHLFWDAGYGFELETTYKSGWLVVFMTVVLTALTWFFVLM